MLDLSSFPTHPPTHPLSPSVGLWKLKVSDVLDFLTSEGFNAIRLPFSLAMALDLGK